jgi:pimeloyl-ACP methyl ester carboxylesterase
MAVLGDRIRAWQASGVDESFRGRRIHLHLRPGSGGPGREGGEEEEEEEGRPLLLLLHGFPSSSYDFAALIDQLPDVDVLSFDFLGFGLSEKPTDHVYSLLWQADLVEEMVARHGAGRQVLLIAHDMGTSVTTELLARDLAGRLPFALRAVVLFNGSIVLERASLTWVQKLLRSPLGPLAARLSSERLFRRQFASLFSARHPLSERQAADQWALLSAGGGARLGDRLIYYLGERVSFADRWHGAIRDWPGQLGFLWGMQDPVATTDVLAALRELRPSAPVAELAELGHYPQIEAPERVAAGLRAQLSPLL